MFTQFGPPVGVALPDVGIVGPRCIGGWAEKMAVPWITTIEPGLAGDCSHRVDASLPGERVVIAHVFTAQTAVVIPDRPADDPAATILVEEGAVSSPVDIQCQNVEEVVVNPRIDVQIIREVEAGVAVDSGRAVSKSGI